MQSLKSADILWNQHYKSLHAVFTKYFQLGVNLLHFSTFCAKGFYFDRISIHFVFYLFLDIVQLFLQFLYIRSSSVFPTIVHSTCTRSSSIDVHRWQSRRHAGSIGITGIWSGGNCGFNVVRFGIFIFWKIGLFLRKSTYCGRRKLSELLNKGPPPCN